MSSSKLRANLLKMKAKVMDTSALIQIHNDLKQRESTQAAELARLRAGHNQDDDPVLQLKLDDALTKVQKHITEKSALQVHSPPNTPANHHQPDEPYLQPPSHTLSTWQQHTPSMPCNPVDALPGFGRPHTD